MRRGALGAGMAVGAGLGLVLRRELNRRLRYGPWHSTTNAALSVGAGLEWTYAPGRPPLALEVRCHRLRTQLLTFGLGTRFTL